MYLQMDYYKHGSLRNWIQHTHPDAVQKRAVLRQVLLAVACIHSQDILHCDLKGDNVLIADDGTPRLCDFEMSKDLHLALTSTMGGGTLGFMAPEIQSRQSKPSVLSDMYSFGVLILNTISPPGPDEPYPLTDASKLTDPAVKQFLPQLMSTNPADRPLAVQLQAQPYFASAALDEWGRIDTGMQLSSDSCREDMLAIGPVRPAVPTRKRISGLECVIRSNALLCSL